jgi:putative endonuclease
LDLTTGYIERDCSVDAALEDDGLSVDAAKDARQGEREAASSGGRKRTRSKNKAIGRRGEEAAARFLYKRGYEIVERNWKCFAGEVDLIVRDEEALVFVEVKTRSDSSHGFPSEAVTSEKRDKYERIALAYVSNHDLGEMIVRFDVISVVVCGPDRALLKHYINAFASD